MESADREKGFRSMQGTSTWSEPGTEITEALVFLVGHSTFVPFSAHLFFTQANCCTW